MAKRVRLWPPVVSACWLVNPPAVHPPYCGSSFVHCAALVD
jgi:hypothetical protein